MRVELLWCGLRSTQELFVLLQEMDCLVRGPILQDVDVTVRAPASFFCPLNGCLITEPVRLQLKSCSQTFDRRSLQEWFRQYPGVHAAASWLLSSCWLVAAAWSCFPAMEDSVTNRCQLCCLQAWTL